MMQDNRKKTRAEGMSRPPAPEALDLLEIAAVMLQNWWKLLLSALVGALVLYGYASLTYQPTYTATAKLYVNNNKIDIGIAQIAVNSADLSTSKDLVSSYQELINSHLVLDKVGKSLDAKGISGYRYSPLVGRITTRTAGDTAMMYITAWDYDPENAIAIVNTLIEELPYVAEDIIEGSSIKAIDPAYSATIVPSGIRKKVMTGALAGLALAVGIILLFYFYLDDQLQRTEWMMEIYPQLPQLGCVPDMVSDKSGSLGKKRRKQKNRLGSADAAIGENMSFYGVEAYNAIRTNVKLSFHGKKSGHIIGVTSAMAGDGKSYTSVNLAYALAKDNAKVLLIDADMRKLSLNRYFEKDAKLGLSEVLCGYATAEEVIRSGMMHENQSVLLSGSVPPNPSELLGSESMHQFLEQQRENYDYILLDLPPIGSVIDAAAAANYLDGMILVVRHEYTRRKFIRATVRQLELTDVRILGYVYNANVERTTLYSRYYNHYYYSYEKDGDKDGRVRKDKKK